MATSADDRLALIEQNYNDALDNEPNDLADAKTAADVTAIQANVANARSTYFSAVAAALTASGPAIESAFKAAQVAQKSVKTARDASADIPTLIGKLSDATAKATQLLKIAAKA